MKTTLLQVKCPECGGKGSFCTAWDIKNEMEIEVSVSAYRCLPHTRIGAERLNQNYFQLSEEPCELCAGRGTVDYEPEYEPEELED